MKVHMKLHYVIVTMVTIDVVGHTHHVTYFHTQNIGANVVGAQCLSTHGIIVEVHVVGYNIAIRLRTICICKASSLGEGGRYLMGAMASAIFSCVMVYSICCTIRLPLVTHIVQYMPTLHMVQGGCDG